MLERESFIHMVLRNERILGDVASGVGSATPRSQQSVCQGVSASFGSGSRGGKGADREGASMELRAFGEFLGCRFPSLRAALQAMDLTHTGRVACYELESWLRQHMYPGNARTLLKAAGCVEIAARRQDLGRKGSLGLSQLRWLAPSFVRGQYGRPSGGAKLWRKHRHCRCLYTYSDTVFLKEHSMFFIRSRSKRGSRHLTKTYQDGSEGHSTQFSPTSYIRL